MTATTLDPVLEVRRVFDAMPEALFDAWFSREQWQAWIGPENSQSEITLLEPEVGGRYSITMNLSDGRVLPVEGVFKTVNRPSSGKDGALAFTWNWALNGDGETLVRLAFRAVPGGTEVTLIHEGLPTATDRRNNGVGWNGALNKLGRFLKGEKP